MPTFNNLFNNQSTSTTSALLATMKKAPQTTKSSTIIDPYLDETWGGKTAGFSDPGPAFNPYYEYYFSGQDISVAIDGTQGNAAISTLPIMNLGFQITQPKLAIYGFWSYTYDAIAYGARQIAARMELATTYPGYMTSVLQEVAKERLASTNGSYANTAPLSTDDQNILSFWGGGSATEETGASINLYQQHPPFNLVIIYGQQNTSVNQIGASAQKDAGNNPLFLDTNERLVISDQNLLQQMIVLQSCEIVSMSTQYTTSGDVISENYDLIINDISIPS